MAEMRGSMEPLKLTDKTATAAATDQDDQSSAERLNLEALLDDIKAGRLLNVTKALASETDTQTINPAHWSFVARQLQQAGYTDLAHAVFQRMYQSGVFTTEVAFSLVTHALRNEEMDLAAGLASRFVARMDERETFALEVSEAMARALLRQDPATAEALTKDGRPQDTETALLHLDAIRQQDRLGDADDLLNGPLKELCLTDPRFRARRARVREQLGDWNGALEDWRHLFDESNDSTAALMIVRILRKQERMDELAKATSQSWLRVADPLARLELALLLEDHEATDAALSRLFDVRPIEKPWDGDDRRRFDAAKDALITRGKLGLALFIEQRDRLANHERADAWVADLLDLLPNRQNAQLLQAAAGIEQRKIDSWDLAANLITEGIGRFRQADAVPFQPDLRLPAKRPRLMLVNATLAAGGAERQLLLYIDGLLQGGMPSEDIHLCLYSLNKDRGHDHFLSWLQSLGVPYTDLSTLNLPEMKLEDRSFVPLLPEPLRQDVARLTVMVSLLQPEIIHGWQDRSSLAGAWAGLESHCERIVMSARNMQPQKRNMVLAYGQPLMKAFLATSAVRLTANSHAGARDYEDWLDLEPGSVTTLLNSLQPDRIPLQPSWVPTKASSATPPLVLGGVFRFANNKRPLLWLKILQHLKQHAPFEVRSILLGNGPLRTEAQAWAAQQGLGEDVIEWRPSKENAGEIYAGMSALLLASRVEGTPNVVLEAQASGLPVVACDVGGVREAMLLHADGNEQNDNLLLEADIAAEAAAEAIIKWWPRVARGSADARRRAVLDAYDYRVTANAALALYGRSEAAS